MVDNYINQVIRLIACEIFEVERELNNAPRMETDAEMQDEKHMALHTEERLNMIGFGDIVKVSYDRFYLERWLARDLR